MVGGKCGCPNAFLSPGDGDTGLQPSPKGPGCERHLADPDPKSHSTLGQGVKVGVSISHRGEAKLTSQP